MFQNMMYQQPGMVPGLLGLGNATGTPANPGLPGGWQPPGTGGPGGIASLPGGFNPPPNIFGQPPQIGGGLPPFNNGSRGQEGNPGGLPGGWQPPGAGGPGGIASLPPGAGGMPSTIPGNPNAIPGAVPGSIGQPTGVGGMANPPNVFGGPVRGGGYQPPALDGFGPWRGQQQMGRRPGAPQVGLMAQPMPRGGL